MITTIDVNEIQEVQTKNRRKYGSFAKAIPQNMQEEIATTYSNGSTLQDISEQYMIAIPVLREYLSNMNILRNRGQGISKRGRKSTKNVINEDIITNAMGMIASMGLIKTAKNLGVNSTELSNELRSRGIEIKKGRPSKKA